MLIISPDPFISQSSPDHSPQSKIDFSYYEISGPDIYSLICAVLWVSLVWPFTFCLNLPQHTVFSSHILDEKKAIKAWVFSNDAYHLFIVTFYFQISAQWEQVTIKELKSKTRRNSDILYAVQGIKNHQNKY